MHIFVNLLGNCYDDDDERLYTPNKCIIKFSHSILVTRPIYQVWNDARIFF